MSVEWVPVTELYVQCAFPMRPDAIAMSDCCRKPATSAVEDPYDTLYYYRCAEHKGMFRDNMRGIVHHTVPRKINGE